MFISEVNYLAWQEKLNKNILFRKWWQFWSNYAVVFFAANIIYVLFHRQGIKIILLMLIAFAIARFIAVEVINKLYKKQRPYQRYDFDPITSRLLSLKSSKPTSFPSRHASSFAAVATTVFWYHPVWGLLLLFVTVMAGAGRVILGYHYPEDIVAGLILGAVVGLFVVNFISPLLFT